MEEVEFEVVAGTLPTVAILFTHFAPYHIDRIEAAAARLKGRARVLGVECASGEDTYSWEPKRETCEADYLTLFPGRKYEDIGRLERLIAYAEKLRHCEWVLSGIPWSDVDIVALSWRRRAKGRKMVAMSCSKFDDKPRNLVREQVKSKLLQGYSSAIVAGPRQRDYLMFLGFDEADILPGYNTLSVERVRQQAPFEPVAWADRPFTYVGRLVGKKNLPTLLEGYRRYAAAAGKGARRLMLVGDGPLRGELETLAETLGIANCVTFAGATDSAGVSAQLSRALALCLVSTEEQWGNVVNEAVALGIPSITSPNVGAGDALVRSGVSGHVVEPASPESIARAMAATASSEANWVELSRAASEHTWLADAARFADAVEMLVDPENGPAADIERFWQECEVG
ncbi:glycosyltransferase [Qipengyuania soli]|uniref:Glycosyltransferase n=1 Tax=Qipengyuania soli TaxID=2782568 RepID=A0A7S8IVI4_9SPHN|nr:glycosyltransferase [Qipengyuania soli]QPC99645.1 glycosyltransferase [Qipengyuania soli]